ncbi:MAG TPA: DUF3090 family protein [Actinomycetota bacterium]|nr:DUF3090 family protein [Actinomycetota bacterium]
MDWITTGAVGEPGERTFYLQASVDGQVLTLLLEKEQVDALCRHVQALLISIGEEQPGKALPAPVAPDLQEPLEPRFRVGQMGLRFDPDRDLVLLQCRELSEDDEEEADDDEDDVDDLDDNEPLEEGEGVSLWAAPAQMRSLAVAGAAAVAAGRPRCKLCGQPLTPEGHFCAAQNGHR